MGDAQLEKNPTDGSGPIKSYKTATTLNPKSVKGILREGKLYQRGRNYQLALDKYKAVNGKYGRNYLLAGETIKSGEFIGSPSGNCYLMMVENTKDCTQNGLQLLYQKTNCSTDDFKNQIGSNPEANGLYTINNREIINAKLREKRKSDDNREKIREHRRTHYEKNKVELNKRAKAKRDLARQKRDLDSAI